MLPKATKFGNMVRWGWGNFLKFRWWYYLSKAIGSSPSSKFDKDPPRSLSYYLIKKILKDTGTLAVIPFKKTKQSFSVKLYKSLNFSVLTPYFFSTDYCTYNLTILSTEARLTYDVQ